MAPRARLVLLLCLVLRATATLAQAEQDAPGANLAPPETLSEERNNQPEPAGSPAPRAPQAEPQEEESDWGLNSIRDSFQAVNGYFDSVVEIMGGRNGVCQYRCRYGKYGAETRVCEQW